MENRFFNSNFITSSYSINELLKFNKGKKVCVILVFPSGEKEFSGILECTGVDHITLSEPSTGKWNVLPICFIGCILFDENINYS